MPNEDDRFAEIISHEFDEHWQREPSEPAADFHLNLYDDEESYRAVSSTIWVLGKAMLRGLILMGIGLGITLFKIVVSSAPTWVGWLGIICFIAGTCLAIFQALGGGADLDDDEGVV